MHTTISELDSDLGLIVIIYGTKPLTDYLIWVTYLATQVKNSGSISISPAVNRKLWIG